MTFNDLLPLAPVIAVFLGAAAVLLVDLAWPGRSAPALATAFVGLGIAAALVITTGATPTDAFGGAYTVDAFTTFIDFVLIGVVVLTILFAPDYLEPRDLPIAEFAAVMMFAISGAMLIAGATDLLLLFLGLELVVLPGYLQRIPSSTKNPRRFA